MKRLTQFGFVALLILAPVGVLLAAKTKTPTTKKTAETKISHRSAKQKAANAKLIKELLAIMEATDNKQTFAACAECLTQLKPPREVVVPAIIRKVDKMGWLKADGSDNSADFCELLLQFLPNKQNRQTTPVGYPTAPSSLPVLQFTPPPPGCGYSSTNAIYQVPYQIPQPCLQMPQPCLQTQPCPYPTTAPAGTCPQLPQPCPCPCPINATGLICPPPPPSSAVEMLPPPVMPSTGCLPATFRICVNAEPASSKDKMTQELLKVLNETESKLTFVILASALYERGENWDAAVPAIIRKADKMGWLKTNDPNDEAANEIAELVAKIAVMKPKAAETQAKPEVLPLPRCGDVECPSDATERMKMLKNQSEDSGPIGQKPIVVPCFPYPLSIDRIDGGIQ